MDPPMIGLLINILSYGIMLVQRYLKLQHTNGKFLSPRGANLKKRFGGTPCGSRATYVLWPIPFYSARLDVQIFILLVADNFNNLFILIYLYDAVIFHFGQ